METRTAGMIVTIATAFICGIAAILACVFGILGVTQVPFDAATNGVPTGSAPMPASLGYTLLCVSLIFFSVPVVVGFVTLRKKPTPPAMSEPLPPAS